MEKVRYPQGKMVFESPKHWILELDSGGFEVYRKETTASVRCAQIGFKGEEGLRRALAELRRRES